MSSSAPTTVSLSLSADICISSRSNNVIMWDELKRLQQKVQTPQCLGLLSLESCYHHHRHHHAHRHHHRHRHTHQMSADGISVLTIIIIILVLVTILLLLFILILILIKCLQKVLGRRRTNSQSPPGTNWPTSKFHIYVFNYFNSKIWWHFQNWPTSKFHTNVFNYFN